MNDVEAFYPAQEEKKSISPEKPKKRKSHSEEDDKETKRKECKYYCQVPVNGNLSQDIVPKDKKTTLKIKSSSNKNNSRKQSYLQRMLSSLF